MADNATPRHPQPDPTLPQILAALQSIAAAVNRGTDVLVAPGEDRTPSQEQSTTILDYLVLRELAGRPVDGEPRTVAATRFSGQLVVFDGAIPAAATKVAVFTRRSIAPDEVPEITDDVDVAKREGAKLTPQDGQGGDTLSGFVLDRVLDTQPIVRLELRGDDDRAVALGPRLGPTS